MDSRSVEVAPSVRSPLTESRSAVFPISVSSEPLSARFASVSVPMPPIPGAIVAPALAVKTLSVFTAPSPWSVPSPGVRASGP